ncbi:sarcosine oxidase subunit alpha family protein [Granulibacter bethesdensis]|uniref:sarcosine oxidase subunit alpha family protein n=1 Tax=Granulibacter bethesdensis TaxID=364410 RepID=UPI0003F1F31E|nr:sarcosine oxidase subunit alpha family protein [Granulibacter bethesdensis]AHJ64545.1 Sarcosine oxidase alpha subunit [Granulibacter bethesdensis CGDNIH4]
MMSAPLSQSCRLPSGGMIDRTSPLHFHFDGRAYTGHAGDTLASALLANGLKLVGRSFKYHRPRGILSAGEEEPNALVHLRSGARQEPNTRATTIELFDGLTATSQNRFPSLRFDLLSVNQLISPFLTAGFYYKTFMWPAAFWEKLYEPAIRRAAGLGALSGEADPDRYEKATAFCDVLVIGSGPAGLAAAVAAARTGARVILAEQDHRLGGRTLTERRDIDGQPAAQWAAMMEAELAACAEARIFRRTTVFGVYDGGTYGALERVADHLPVTPDHLPRQRLWRFMARRCVLATGSIERPLVFDGNDRPGVMLAGSVRSYVNRFAVRPGQRAVIALNNDDAARTAADLAAAGLSIAALIDQRVETSQAVRDIAHRTGARLFAGAHIKKAHGGASGIRSVSIAGTDGGVATLRADLLAMSGGWTPALHLTTHLGGKPRWDDTASTFLPDTARLPPGMSVVGAASGCFGLGAGIAEGTHAGLEAAESCGFSVSSAPALPTTDDLDADPAQPLGQVRSVKGKAFIDFQNDVTAKDVALAHQEGFVSVEHLKRYTTLGMATDQGKTANINGLALMAGITGAGIPATGTTGFRPPYTPVSIGALGGAHHGPHYRPRRLTPLHRWAEARGGVFTEVGQWMRAQYFPRPGESDWLATATREVNAVRNRVGFCDVSTLGKIDIQGADAAEFLDRVCVNRLSRIRSGRAGYLVMLREDGFVLDDGTAARLGEDHYLLSASTAHAGQVFQHLLYCHQCLWPELDVQIASVTEQWAQIAIAGPRSRDVLHRLIDPAFDLSREAFPRMSVAETMLTDGTPVRLFGLSFSGELAYELAVPARRAAEIADRLIEAGAEFDITPYGTEAMGIMRVEKAYPAGSELNGQVTLHDLNAGGLMADKECLGRAMALRPALTDPGRPRLIGLRPVDAGFQIDPGIRMRAGAHLLPRGAEASAAHDQGFITSAVYSPTLGHWIALALLCRGPERAGEIIRVYDPVRGEDYLAEIVSSAFVDPAGDRSNV